MKFFKAVVLEKYILIFNLNNCYIIFISIIYSLH